MKNCSLHKHQQALVDSMNLDGCAKYLGQVGSRQYIVKNNLDWRRYVLIDHSYSIQNIDFQAFILTFGHTLCFSILLSSGAKKDKKRRWDERHISVKTNYINALSTVRARIARSEKTAFYFCKQQNET